MMAWVHDSFPVNPKNPTLSWQQPQACASTRPFTLGRFIDLSATAKETVHLSVPL